VLLDKPEMNHVPHWQNSHLKNYQYKNEEMAHVIKNLFEFFFINGVD